MIFHNEFVADVLTGNCIESMQTLPDKTVNCCVTSPPYFGLRDYGMDEQLGLESTPEEYVAAMVDVFREVKRVLRDDGTLWLNIGDSYCAPNGRSSSGNSYAKGPNSALKHLSERQDVGIKRSFGDAKPKDLIGIPWMLAFALRADGWYLRQDIIWHKPNPMPESVKDRCTKAHEYIFLLSKSEKYYFDSDAIQEPAAPSSIKRWAQNIEAQTGSGRVPGKTNGNMKAVGGSRSKRDSFKREGSKRVEVLPGQTCGTHRPNRDESEWNTETRNRRSVWSVATRPYKGAHFATFPPDLIEPCVRAGCPPNGIVLDPFGGSGTTGGVALRNGRHAILCELNPEYVAIMPERIGALCK